MYCSTLKNKLEIICCKNVNWKTHKLIHQVSFIQNISEYKLLLLNYGNKVFWYKSYFPNEMWIYTFNFYFGDAPPLNWTDITRWNYIESGIAEPPQLTLYTYFTIEQYLGFFMCIFAIQFVFHLALKVQTNPFLT